MQPAAQRVSDVRIALKQSERVLDGVDEGPAQIEQLLCAPRENDCGHASTGGSTLCELATKIVERDAVASRQFSEASFDGGEGRRIREDFRGLFKRFVFVDWNERRGWLAVTGHEHVISTISDVI